MGQLQAKTKNKTRLLIELEGMYSGSIYEFISLILRVNIFNKFAGGDHRVPRYWQEVRALNPCITLPLSLRLPSSSEYFSLQFLFVLREHTVGSSASRGPGQTHKGLSRDLCGRCLDSSNENNWRTRNKVENERPSEIHCVLSDCGCCDEWWPRRIQSTNQGRDTRRW